MWTLHLFVAYGFLLEHGQGVSHDDAMAARYYDAAAKQNSVPAQNNLGMMYAQGRGVARDDGRVEDADGLRRGRRGRYRPATKRR